MLLRTLEPRCQWDVNGPGDIPLNVAFGERSSRRSGPSMPVDTAGDLAQAATIAVGPSGTWIAGGYYDYLGRSTDGHTFASVAPTMPTSQWFNGIAAAPNGNWWAIGEGGVILHSGDDGMTWAAQTSPVTDDFYGVSFLDASQGIAVGRDGIAVVTTDGGATWQDVSTGLDLFLAGATWLDPTTALVVGESGTVLDLHIN